MSVTTSFSENITGQTQKLIQHFEDCRLEPYRCPTGRWSIGYGSTTLADGSAVKSTTLALTKAQAEELLRQNIQVLQYEVLDAVSVPLNPTQAIALTSFIYNVGIINFISSTLRKKLNEGAFQDTADELLRWNHINGYTMPTLTKRRQIERAIFLGQEVTL